MSMLEAALAWAARGFRVFPIRALEKDQPLFEGWQHHATTDPTQIRMWWSDPTGLTSPMHNIGYVTTDMVVVDADPKKNGIASAFETLALGFDTLIIRTPSGGYHFVYNGPDSANSVGKVAPGVDIRSHHGYALAPGSKRRDGDYTLELDLEPIYVPETVRCKLTLPLERPDQIVAENLELDRPDAIALATELLGRLEPAIEGAGGDAHTYQVACKVRDLGVSEDICVGLMLEHWNERCSPPWDSDELAVKVQNAYDYSTGQAGSKHPAVAFNGVQLPTPAPPVEEPPLPSISFGNAMAQQYIPQRDFRIARLLLRGNITHLIAPGGASKSTVGMVLAAHKAVGQDFAGLAAKKGKTVIYNSEDDLAEMSRRLNAICIHYGFDFDEVRSQIMLIDRTMIPLKLTENNPPVLNTEHVRFLIEHCSDPECDLLILDPMVSLLSSSEDDNQSMDYVMDVIKIICREAQVAGLIVDHTKKPSGQSQAGDMSAARGASSKAYAARIVLTLTTATQEDCDKTGISPDERHAYVRLDDAKMNMSLASGKPLWLRKHGVRLLQGDEVGVVAPVDLAQISGFVARQMAAILLQEMTGKGSASLPIDVAAAVLRGADAMYGAMTPTVVKNRMVRYLTEAVELNGNRVRIVHDGKTSLVVLD